jgi:hypothetical protein
MKTIVALLLTACIGCKLNAQDHISTLYSIDEAGQLQVPDTHIAENTTGLNNAKLTILPVDTFYVQNGAERYQVVIKLYCGYGWNRPTDDHLFNEFSIYNNDGQELLTFRNVDAWEHTGDNYKTVTPNTNRYAQIFPMENGSTLLYFTGWYYDVTLPYVTMVVLYDNQAKVVYNEPEKLEQYGPVRVADGGYFNISFLDKQIFIPTPPNFKAQRFNITSDRKGVYLSANGTYSYARDGEI